MRNMLKRLVAPLLYALYRLFDPIFRFHDVAILCYHSINDAGVDTAVSPEMFGKHLAYLTSQGHMFVSTQQIVDWFTKGTPVPRKSVAITFDDGYADFETNALPVLARFNAPAAVFVVGDENASRARLGNDIPLLSHETIERLKNNPLITVGSHGITHADMRHLTGAALREEMMRESDIRYFAFAGGAYTREGVDLAKELGYEAAFSIKPGLVTKRSEPYLLQRNVILRGMSPQDVEFRTTRAIEWYTRLSRSLK